MFDLFVFDFDGTIADSRQSICNSINFALEQHSYSTVDASLIYPCIGKLMLPDTFLLLYPTISAEELPKILESFRTYQREHVKEDLRYFPEARETLLELKARGKKLAILSNKRQGAIEDALNAFDYAELFDFVLGSGVLSAHKPDKACMELIWQQLPTAPERTVMIGDSEVDVQTAKNAGIAMIAVGHGTDSAESLLAMGANYAVERLGELLEYA